MPWGQGPNSLLPTQCPAHSWCSINIFQITINEWLQCERLEGWWHQKRTKPVSQTHIQPTAQNPLMSPQRPQDKVQTPQNLQGATRKSPSEGAPLISQTSSSQTTSTCQNLTLASLWNPGKFPRSLHSPRRALPTMRSLPWTLCTLQLHILTNTKADSHLILGVIPFWNLSLTIYPTSSLKSGLIALSVHS